MKVLITGINGFVGTYLRKELEEKGHNVYGIDVVTHDSKVFVADICNKEQLSSILGKISPDYVYHLAAIANVDFNNPAMIYDTNVGGTQTLLSSCIGLAKKPSIVFISSSQVYGQVPVDMLPIKESYPVSPVNHYGASKAASEVIVRAFGFEYDIPYVIFRPFNHTGVGQTDKFVVPKIVNAFRNKSKTIELGNIDVTRDFSDVRDVVVAYAGVVDSFRNREVYNISSGSGVTIRAIVDILSSLTGQNMIIDEKLFLKRSNEIESVIGDNSKLKTDLKWKMRYSIREMLAHMVNA